MRSERVNPRASAGQRRAVLRLTLLWLVLACTRCDCIYPYDGECRGLDEQRCAAKSDEVVEWTKAHCVVVRSEGRFVRCRPIANTGCGF